MVCDKAEQETQLQLGTPNGFSIFIQTAKTIARNEIDTPWVYMGERQLFLRKTTSVHILVECEVCL